MATIEALKSKAEFGCASGREATACQEAVTWRVRCDWPSSWKCRLAATARSASEDGRREAAALG